MTSKAEGGAPAAARRRRREVGDERWDTPSGSDAEKLVSGNPPLQIPGCRLDATVFSDLDPRLQGTPDNPDQAECEAC